MSMWCNIKISGTDTMGVLPDFELKPAIGLYSCLSYCNQPYRYSIRLSITSVSNYSTGTQTFIFQRILWNLDAMIFFRGGTCNHQGVEIKCHWGVNKVINEKKLKMYLLAPNCKHLMSTGLWKLVSMSLSSASSRVYTNLDTRSIEVISRQ